MGAPLLTSVERSDLAQLVVEVAWRIDHGAADTVYELFTEDAVMQLGDQSPIRGRHALMEWGDRRVALPRRTIHSCANFRFRKIDPETADGTVAVTIYLAEGGRASSTPFAVGEFTDVYRRAPNGWLVEARTMTVLFDRELGPPSG
jgi:hypothetical protein